MKSLLFLLLCILLSCSSEDKNSYIERNPIEGEWHLYQRVYENFLDSETPIRIEEDREFIEKNGACELVIVTAEDNGTYLFSYIYHDKDTSIPEQALHSDETWWDHTEYSSTSDMDSISYSIYENGAQVLINTKATQSNKITSYYLPNAKKFDE